MKLAWPAPERNKAPILDVLRQVLAPAGTLLEIASGTGQHAAYFAAELPAWTWRASELDDKNLASIAAWVAQACRPNLPPPLRIDVCALEWGAGQVDAIFNANMIHIAPWECCVGLIAGAARHLRAGGVLVLYGPFRLAGAHTAESNARFDAELKTRDPRYGVRDTEAVIELAATAGLAFERRFEMPANNQCLVFRRRSAAKS